MSSYHDTLLIQYSIQLLIRRCYVPSRPLTALNDSYSGDATHVFHSTTWYHDTGATDETAQAEVTTQVLLLTYHPPIILPGCGAMINSWTWDWAAFYGRLQPSLSVTAEWSIENFPLHFRVV